MFRAGIGILLAVFLAAVPAWSETLPDPTRPLGYQVSRQQAPKLVLQAIYARESGSTAVINGRLVKAGDRIEPYRIVKITENKVYYERKGQTRVLALRENIFEKK